MKTCPKCGGSFHRHSTVTNKSGNVADRFRCRDCGKTITVRNGQVSTGNTGPRVKDWRTSSDGEETNRGTHGRFPDVAKGAGVQGLPAPLPGVLEESLRGAGCHEGRGDRPGTMGCKRCGGEMNPGKAIAQTFSGSSDFTSGPVVTMPPDGPGRLIQCLKCSSCGWSIKA